MRQTSYTGPAATGTDCAGRQRREKGHTVHRPAGIGRKRLALFDACAVGERRDQRRDVRDRPVARSAMTLNCAVSLNVSIA